MTAPFLGMLDWGVGGLGCYRLLKQARADLPVLYLSDTGAVPYGRLSSSALRARVQQALGWLIAQGASSLLVACNAASTVLPGLTLPVPCTGMIEHGLRAVPDGQRGLLGVLGGARTIRSGLYQRGLARAGLRVRGRVAQPLSAQIEAGTTHTAQFADDLRRIMAPLARADALLLACTHYPAVRERLGAHAPRALLIDPAERLVAALLDEPTLPVGRRADRFVCTGDGAAMIAAARRVFDVRVPRCEALSLRLGDRELSRGRGVARRRQ